MGKNTFLFSCYQEYEEKKVRKFKNDNETSFFYSVYPIFNKTDLRKS